MDSNSSQQPIQNLNQTLSQNTDQNIHPNSQNQLNNKKSINNKFIFVGIIIVALILILIGFGVFIFLNLDRDEKTGSGNMHSNTFNEDLEVSKQSAVMNIDEINPHELIFELSEKGREHEYVYYKEIHELERLSGENWHYKKYWKKIPINKTEGMVDATVNVPGKGVYSIYGDEYSLIPTNDDSFGTYNDYYMGSYSVYLKDNDSLKLNGMSVNDDNLIVYEFSYNDDVANEIEKIWVTENGLFLKKTSTNNNSISTVEYRDYSLEKFPTSVFDIPESLKQ